MDTITIFGAQGKFGSKLYIHLQQIQPEHTTILTTTDRNHNKELALQTDIVILCVKKTDAINLLEEIKTSLPEHALIISFIAGFESSRIEDILQTKSIIQYMADPNWILGAYSLHTSTVTNIPVWLENLCTFTKQLNTENDIHEFTILISNLYVLTILTYLNPDPQLDTLKKNTAQKLGVSVSCLNNIVNESNAEYTLETICTPNGISEFLYKTYIAKKVASVEEIVTQAKRKFFT